MKADVKFKYWLTVAKYAGYKLEEYSRPKMVGGKETPETLQEITMGQLIELSELTDSNESLYAICRILLGLNREQVDEARAVDVVRFCGWCITEVERINKLFKATHIEPTAEERQAGVDKLQFGLFGMIDSYARRMGISNHDDVMNVSWIKIYKCIDMDNKITQYQRRLNKVYERKMQRK